MKKIIFLVSIFLISNTCFAASLSEALFFKYGGCFGTKQADELDKSQNPKMVISYWRCSQLQPQESEFDKIIQDYISAKQISDNEKKTKHQSVLSKLKITEQELQDLLS